MAVMRNSIIFGGINSADYGIYIGGEGTFNAPARQVEMVEVPGRNGSIAVDQGRWENITVTYSAFNYEEDLETFAQQLSDFRNAIYSQIGYQRLTDTFHPDEYRMAICVDPLEIKPIDYNTASQFEIKFNCKPQRWLTSGETAVTVASGDVLTNPTPYDAGPLLMAEGYGTISFNGYDIDIENVTLGNVLLATKDTVTAKDHNTSYINSSNVNTGDEITIDGGKLVMSLRPSLSGWRWRKSTTTTSVSDSDSTHFDSSYTFSTDYVCNITTNISELKYNKGTETRWTDTITFSGKYGDAQLTTESVRECNITITVTLIGRPSYLRFEITYDSAQDGIKVGSVTRTITIGEITAESTKSALGHPNYIDCEIGEAYMIIDGQPYSLNQYISFGSDLPVLKSGDNEITLDNTITELKVKPNWWKL